MIRSNQLTLVKQWSTWAITSKTQPTTPNDPPLPTLVKLGQNPSQDSLKTLCPSLSPEKFCRVLQISSKHFKFPQKVMQFVEGHNFHVVCHLRFGV
jgi:hypothetical protein